MDEVTQEQIKKYEILKKNILLKILTKEAYQRLGNIRVAKPEFAMQIELYLVQLYQEGHIKSLIDEKKLKQMLGAFAQKRDFKIKRL